MSIFYFPPAQDPLSWEEMAMVDYFKRALERRVEEENAILMKEIVARAQFWKKSVRMSTAMTRCRITRIIRYIRINHILPNLCAGNSGFFVTYKPDVLAAYIHKLNSRAGCIMMVSDEMLKDWQRMLISKKNII